jgi:hypothetical protein
MGYTQIDGTIHPNTTKRHLTCCQCKMVSYYLMPRLRFISDRCLLDKFLEKRERVGLNSLRSCDESSDEPSRHTIRMVLECVILGSPHKMLTFGEICFALRLRFSYYERCDAQKIRWRVSSLLNISIVPGWSNNFSTIETSHKVTSQEICPCQDRRKAPLEGQQRPWSL